VIGEDVYKRSKILVNVLTVHRIHDYDSMNSAFSRYFPSHLALIVI